MCNTVGNIFRLVITLGGLLAVSRLQFFFLVNFRFMLDGRCVCARVTCSLYGFVCGLDSYLLFLLLLLLLLLVGLSKFSETFFSFLTIHCAITTARIAVPRDV